MGEGDDGRIAACGGAVRVDGTTGGSGRAPEREIVTINFPLMGVQRRNEVVRENRGGNSVASDRTLAVTNSRHIASPTLMT